jgi:Pretoxin HINT domain
MVHVILLCCAIIGDEARPGPFTPADRVAYKTAQTKAGNDAAAHVRLALWCEEHGLSAERLKHLALAMSLDPANTLARGLSGLVAYHGKWKSPAEVGKEVEHDPAHDESVREYLERRARVADTPDAQLKLADWCAQRGLKEQATAHYTEVTRLDPSREIAWKHLGYKKQGRRWVKPEEAAAEKLEAEHQKRADFHWKPRLEKLREELESPHAARRAKAEEAMAVITDPRAVPMIAHVLGAGKERSQLAAVQLLGKIQGPASSSALADLAVWSPLALVRQRVPEVLALRDPRDVVGRLIALVRRPYKYEVRLGNGPGSVGELLVDGERFDLRRLYQFPTIDFRLVPVGQQALPGAANLALAANSGMTMQMPSGRTAIVAGMAPAMGQQRQQMLDAAKAEIMERNMDVEDRMYNDMVMLDTANAQMTQVNDRVLPVLTKLTGNDFGNEPESWKKWWTDQLGYVYASSQPSTKETFTDTVGSPDIVVPMLMPVVLPRPHSACFAAGTLVHTIDGPRPIESIELGDRVLAQNTTTGLLTFEPVVATHRNQHAPTLRITVAIRSASGRPSERGDETIVATGIHRFWKAGQGWTMARELKTGDCLRMVGGVVEVQSVDDDATQPVYNLDVAQDRDFFVGKTGLLVHDFSFVQPVAAPFDGLPGSDVNFSGPPK